jgi:hypothetical protein
MKARSCGVPTCLALALAGAVAIASATTIGACSSGGTAQRGNSGSAGAPGANSAGATGRAGASQTAGVAGTAGVIGGAGVTGDAGSSGAAGATGTAGGPGTSGTTGGAGAAGSAGATGSGGASGAAGATSTTGGELAKGPFSCSTYIGAALSSEWWGQGFETIIDNTKWQLKWHHHGFVEAWGDPASPFWGDTGDPNDPNGGSPYVSACTQNSKTPDRVVFLAMDWVLLTEQDWIAWLEKDLTAIKLKYPGVRWIDIMPTVRCPNNRMCNPNAKPGPGANDGAGPEDCYIPPFEDSAIAKVVAGHADSVGLGPIVMATMCNGGNGGHLTGADNKLAATAIGNFYKALP